MSGTTAHSSLGDTSDLLNQTISLSYELLNDILISISELPPFEARKEAAWNLRFARIASDIGHFVELTTLWSKLAVAKRQVELPVIKDSHVHLLFIMKAITQAQLKLDSVVLEDLIKYELKDILTQWKIDLIPQMKRLVNA